MLDMTNKTKYVGNKKKYSRSQYMSVSKRNLRTRQCCAEVTQTDGYKIAHLLMYWKSKPP